MRKIITKGFLWYSNNAGKIIFWTCSIALSVLFLERVAIIFTYQGHLAGIDNNFDYPVIRSLAGFSLYPDPNSYPFAVNPYAPGFFIVCKWMATGLNFSADDTMAIYRISRTVALLADTGTCLLLFSILRSHVRIPRSGAVILTSLFYIILCYLGYSFNRSDCLFLLFYSLSFFVLLSPRPGNKIIRAFLLALSVFLSIFSKQNGISLLVLASIWLFYTKEFKQLTLFILFSIIFCLGAFYYFDFIYTNQGFSAHVFHALNNRIDPKWFYIYIFKLIADSHLILPLTLAIVAAIKAISENKNKLLAGFSILFLTQLLINIGLCFKWGSSLGYFNESFFIAFIILAFWGKEFSKPESLKSIHTIGSYVYPVFLIFVLHIVLQLYFYFINNATKARAHFDQQVTISNYLKKEIGGKNYYILDLSQPDIDFFKNLLYKESAAPNFDAVNCCTLPDKIFDYGDLIKGLQNGKILFLIEGKSNHEKSLWNTSLDKYVRDTIMGDYTLYRFDLKKISQ